MATQETDDAIEVHNPKERRASLPVVVRAESVADLKLKIKYFGWVGIPMAGLLELMGAQVPGLGLALATGVTAAYFAGEIHYAIEPGLRYAQQIIAFFTSNDAGRTTRMTSRLLNKSWWLGEEIAPYVDVAAEGEELDLDDGEEELGLDDGERGSRRTTASVLRAVTRRPTVKTLASLVTRNSLQFMVGLGLDGEYHLVDLDERHIKIIGATRKGKSCLAAAILHQLSLTHDPACLRFHILDLEHKTSRLFTDNASVLRLRDPGTGQAVPAIAKTCEEVANHLTLLAKELERRYLLPEAVQARLPHTLIYFEEFLDFKRRIKGAARNKALDSFTLLATRGLKVHMHLMICAQLDHMDEDVRDAMYQFTGVNVSFCVNPTAARAAGFMCNDLLTENYAAKTRGQYVIEADGLQAIGTAPDYDVKAMLARIAGPTMSAEEEAILARELADSIMGQLPDNASFAEMASVVVRFPSEDDEEEDTEVEDDDEVEEEKHGDMVVLGKGVWITKEEFQVAIRLRQAGRSTGYRDLMPLFNLSEHHAKVLNALIRQALGLAPEK